MIAGELGGNGVRLVEALRARGDERLQGFRGKSADKLESFLIDAGYLDPRPLLTEPDVVVRTMATPAASRLPGRVASECVRRWWSLCERASRRDDAAVSDCEDPADR